MARLLVTGTRHGWDLDQLFVELARACLDLGGPEAQPTLVHGAADGVDSQAAKLWTDWGLPVEEHPADWSQGKSAGPRRNQEMVDLGADLCLAFVAPDSRGTRHCSRAAAEAGIEVRAFFS